MRKYNAKMFTTAIAKIAASEKSITGPRLAAAPMTMKTQKIDLNVNSDFFPSPNRYVQLFKP